MINEDELSNIEYAIDSLTNGSNKFIIIVKSNELCDLYMKRHRATDIIEFFQERLKKFSWLQVENIDKRIAADINRISKFIYELVVGTDNNNITRITNMSYEDLRLFDEMPKTWRYDDLKQVIDDNRHNVRKNVWTDPVQADLFCKEFHEMMES